MGILSNILANPALIGLAMAGMSRDPEAPMNAMRSYSAMDEMKRKQQEMALREEERARELSGRAETIQALKGYGNVLGQDQNIDLSMLNAHPELKAYALSQMQRQQQQRKALSGLVSSAGPNADLQVLSGLLSKMPQENYGESLVGKILESKLKPNKYSKTDFLGENDRPIAFDENTGAYTADGQPYQGPVKKFKADPKEMNPQLVGHTVAWKDPNTGMVVPKGLPVSYKNGQQYILFNGKEFEYNGPTDPRITNPVIPNVFTYIPTSEGFVPMPVRGAGTGNVSTGVPLPGLGKPIPSEQLTSGQQAGTLDDMIGRVQTLYKPEYVGPFAGRYSQVKENYVGLPTEQGMFYSDLAQASNMIVYLFSGKQINEQEYKRLKAALPDRNLPPETFEARMKNFTTLLNDIKANRASQLQQGGYGPQPGTPQSVAPGKQQKRIVEERIGKDGRKMFKWSDGTITKE